MNADALQLMLERELPAAAGGCSRSYGRIVSACQNTVTAIALAITRDVQVSEDIAQEAFLKAWQKLSRLNSHASFLPWLRQITRNLARDWLRANRGRPLTGEGAEIAIGMAADPDPTPSERLLRLEEEIAAEDIISSLPEDSREALLLYYREGQSSQQVASLLGLSDTAVRKRLSRARASVREEMFKRFGDFARSSAPSIGFAAAVSSAMMLAAPSTASAVVIGTAFGGSAGKLGASGVGLNTLGGGAAAGSLGMAGNTFMASNGNMAIVLASIATGLLAGYLSGRYLQVYAETHEERMQLQGFLRKHTLASVAFCASVLIVVLLDLGIAAALTALAIGMAVLNYLYLVTLPKVMAPMLARDAARHGRRGPSLFYRSLFGRTAVAGSSALCVIAVLASLLHFL
jgi:RNA polymerase sigma factor (sigma-70 family)